MGFTLNPLGPGAAEIIGLDCSRPISAEDFDAVDKAFIDYPVLVFRDQHMTSPQMATFSKHWGQLESYMVPFDKPQTAALRQTNERETPDQMLYISPENSNVLIMTNEVEKDKTPIAIIDNAEIWHADGSHKMDPYKAVLVYVLRNPANGGETEFCDMRALYDALPNEVQKALRGRLGIHHWSKSKNLRFIPLLDKNALEEGNKIASRIPEMPQPLVCPHPVSGRPQLYLSPRFTIRIDDVPQEHSDSILENIFSLMEDPQFIYRHVWQENDLLIWDNIATCHRVRSYPVHDPRRRYRVTVAGDTPLFRYVG